MNNNYVSDNEDKNAVLVLEGNYQQFEQLQTLFESGELEKMLGIPVLELQVISQHKNLDSVSSKKSSTSTTLLPLTTEIGKKALNLRQWFQNNFDPDWEFFPVVAPVAYRSVNDEIPAEAIIRAKQINLGDAVTLALVISLSPPNEDGEVEIIIKICPCGLTKHLPQGLTITVFDELDDVFEELQANEKDPWLGLRFYASEGQFNIRLVLQEARVEEIFEI
ncbi:MAG: DUF1822 family protein [Symploca sp. SIO2E9]|nr:DUF1822 family protein [Symploca sp. SIO2E9]